MSPSLEGIGVVRFDSPGGPLFLSAAGRVWSLEIRSRSAARELWRVGRVLGRGRRRWAAGAGRALRRGGLRLTVRAGGRTVAVLGRGCRGGWLSRMLAGRYVELRPRQLLTFLLTRSC